MPSAFSLKAADMERASKTRPQTPPYTPSRNKARLQRADSPAPSIHPTETVSPAKKGTALSEVPDTIIVQELAEGHPDYPTDIELVYPDELEEFDSNSYMSDISDSDGDSDNNISNRLSQLQCEDKVGEAKMRRVRRERRLSKRLANRPVKRSHSTSIKSDSDVTDPDAMDDHDLLSSARRLRRKTKDHDDDLHGPMPSPRLASPSNFRFNATRSMAVQRTRQDGKVTTRDITSDEDEDDMDISE
ncbi:hypothetical protein AMS68_001517 [Peltaster fructicola]|uniref:Uncharacterized protein n=1 Tax=Peltaster fructicola TaxID=286661 RepID=A0A6H0XND4_9PEZI|nr:hypothetical protein AMS68_001517 [Peltaster fructicola]